MIWIIWKLILIGILSTEARVDKDIVLEQWGLLLEHEQEPVGCERLFIKFIAVRTGHSQNKAYVVYDEIVNKLLFQFTAKLKCWQLKQTSPYRI